jgi:hypothetical protein
MKKKTIKYTIVLVIIIVSYSLIFNKTEFHKYRIEHLNDSSENVHISEVVIVENPPYFFSSFKKKVWNYIENNPMDTNCYSHTKVFVKEHPRSIGEWFFGDKTEYLKHPNLEINSIDMLFHITREKRHGRDTLLYMYYTGDLWYY